MMQGFAVLGLIIVVIVIYCACTLLTSMIVVSINDVSVETFFFFAWFVGCVMFVMVVLFWATEPFPISMG